MLVFSSGRRLGSDHVTRADRRVWVQGSESGEGGHIIRLTLLHQSGSTIGAQVNLE